MAKPKVPNTVSDRKMADLQRRAQKAGREPMFSKRAVARRQADSKQRGKSRWS
jgi:hypothetical protein